MDSISREIDSASRDCKMAAFIRVHVVGITEEPCNMDVTEVDIGLESTASDQLENADNNLLPDANHVLDEDPEINKNAKAETYGAWRATEGSEADKSLNAKEECVAGVERSGVITETVEDIKNVRVPREKSKWLANWLIEAAEWEGRSWSRDMSLDASRSVQRRASKEDLPFKFSRINRRINTAPIAGTAFTSQGPQETQ